MKRVLLVTAALVAAVAVWTVVSLPPRALALDASWSDGTVAGIIHVHTSRSDGSSPPEVVAAAAARAGLAFVVFTDHGDATRVPDPPTYRAGVLCLDGVEISTTGGHYVALDAGASPYPLGGEPRDVIADVARLGGFGIAAHPDSPKRELAWHDWTSPIDGIEILNPDTAWREHAYLGTWRSRAHLISSLVTYPWRPTETIGALLTPSAGARAAWDRLTAARAVVGVSGVDAHARLALRDTEPAESRFALPIPGYETSFRAMSVRVRPTGSLTGDAVVDASRILAGVRKGDLYTAVDAFAAPPRLTVAMTQGDRQAAMGDAVTDGPGLALQVRHNGGDGFVAQVWKGGAIVSSHDEPEFTSPVTTGPGAYRVEVRDPRHPDGPAWLTSNPVYVRAPQAQPTPSAAPASPPPSPQPPVALFDGRTTNGWTLESDRNSLSAVDVVRSLTGPELRIRYGLAGGARVGQFAGVAVDTLDGAGAYNRITFAARAERPIRLSIQVRAEVRGAPPERWQRSIYLDTTERAYAIDFDDMAAVGETHTPKAPRATIRNVLVIVDTTNSRPGSSGSVWMRNPRLER